MCKSKCVIINENNDNDDINDDDDDDDNDNNDDNNPNDNDNNAKKGVLCFAARIFCSLTWSDYNIP